MAFHVVVQSVLVLLDRAPGRFGDGITIFMVLTALTIFAAFLHVKVYIALARAIIYARELFHLPRLLRLESSLSRALNVRPYDLSVYEVMCAPDYATYQVVIAILDRYRDLRLSPLVSLQRMADALEQIGIRSMLYADLVKALQRVVVPA